MLRRPSLDPCRALSCALLVGSLLLAGAARAEDTPVYIDVRTPAEFAGGAIDGALNIPHDQIAQRIRAAVPDPETPIRLYCKSGGRSGLAKKTLESMGYTRVTNAGGFEALREELSKSP